MSIPRQFALFVCVCFTVACAPASPSVNLAAENEAVNQLTSDWFAAESRRDIEASLSFLAPDAIVQAEGAPTISGTSAIRGLYEEFFKAPFTDLVMEPRIVVVAASGDMAYDIGPWKMVIEGPEGRMEIPWKSTLIWQKIDNQWKCVAASMSMDVPPTPTAE
jgi:uncharacterized protein (TIGR02246 family)